ncbi:MAG: fibronectin type III domain-containing protein, partial [Candidatus Nealsonbacteria bacterium]
NTSRLEDTFVTLEDGAQSEETLTTPEISETSEEEIKDEDSELVLEEEKVVKEIIDFLIGLTNPNSLSSVSTILKESAAKIMSPPLIIGEQFKVEVDQTKATIMWVTDKKSNSLIAYSPEEDYNITKDEPYAIVVGNPDEKVTDHIVEILNLKPSTSYYYQIRSEPAIGPRAESEVKTLKTSSLLLEISDITFEKITESIVNLSWKTNIPARTIIAWTNLETGDEETEENPSFLRDHTFKLEELVPNIDYSLKLVTIDESGNEANSPILSFSTGEDSLAPEIYQVRSDAAISPGGEKVQTIITWLTNEFSSSQVFILEGLNSDPALAISTQVDEALIRKHTVVVPGLKPGTVYLFRVQSTDPSGNTAVSRDFTLLTPQQRKTIIQTIIQNFEETFSWMQRLGL